MSNRFEAGPKKRLSYFEQKKIEAFRFLRKGLFLSMMGFAVSSNHVEDSYRAYIGHSSDKNIENIDDYPEESGLEKIKLMVMEDDFERILLGKGSDNKFIVKKGNKDSCFFEFEDIQKIIDEGERNPTIAHTHPISVYDNVGYTEKEIESMRGNGQSPAPMPPSITDIIGGVGSDEYFDTQGVNLRQKVFDPTGTWEYEYKNNNPNIEKFKIFQEEIIKTLEESITEEDRKILEKYEIILENTHPLKRIIILSSMPETRHIAEKMNKSIEEYQNKISKELIDPLKKVRDIEFYGTEISTIRNPEENQGKIEDLIDQYIKSAAELGFEVRYTRGYN